jgi:hypothetical protein
MGTKRQHALDRLTELTPQVLQHLAKIRGQPNSRDVPHWRAEVRVWLRQMARQLDKLGKRTQAQWHARITGWWAELGETTDD